MSITVSEENESYQFKTDERAGVRDQLICDETTGV